MDFGRFMTGFLVLTGIGKLAFFSMRHLPPAVHLIEYLRDQYGQRITASSQETPSFVPHCTFRRIHLMKLLTSRQ